MLNLGQMVYDFSNERLLLFGGIDMVQDKKAGKCWAEFSFLTPELEILEFSSKGKDKGAPTVPFIYRNFDPVDEAVPIGSFVKATGLAGHYFGNVDWKMVLSDNKLKEAAKKAFEEAKGWPRPKLQI